ncbi:MAG: gephyrin-like molybdotransferase Glp, partial [Verrucomicrobiota bacterium]
MPISPEPMPAFDAARRIILEQTRCTGSEAVPLEQALGRILAEDVASDMDMPPFDKSAMDGYACRRADLQTELRVIEIIPAGQSPQKEIGSGECSKIMTGAAVPSGADCVVPVEITRETGNGRIEVTDELTRDNICRQAEDIHKGDTVLEKGTRIDPQHIGVLATVGCTHPLVARQPVVGVITTGDEIVEPGDTPAPAQIRNSNGHQLCAQVQRAGGLPTYYGIVPDTAEALDAVVKQATEACDVILLSGGVSMGDFDLVPGILKQNGFDLLFEKIAVKPGKPTVFGVSEGAFCFGLPGNPVSTFVIFELLVRPFLEQLMGRDSRPNSWPMQLAAPIRKRDTDRDAWVPVAVTAPGCVQPIAYHGSAHLNALAKADG